MRRRPAPLCSPARNTSLRRRSIFDVIRLCRRYNKLVMPGAFTPTEILTAWEAGADIVKVFPAEVVGPAFFKAMRGPLPQVRLMPTGGVDLNTAADFLRAGACCLGMGSQLVEPRAVAERDFDRIRDLARQYVAIVRQSRSGDVPLLGRAQEARPARTPRGGPAVPRIPRVQPCPTM